MLYSTLFIKITNLIDNLRVNDLRAFIKKKLSFQLLLLLESLEFGNGGICKVISYPLSMNFELIDVIIQLVGYAISTIFVVYVVSR